MGYKGSNGRTQENGKGERMINKTTEDRICNIVDDTIKDLTYYNDEKQLLAKILLEMAMMNDKMDRLLMDKEHEQP